MSQNARRFDLSRFLIHFFRRVDTLSDNAPSMPEDMGFNNIVEEDICTPLFLLRCAIRHCMLWATWSVRGGARTIYGPRPAVCFTEMPVAAFLETSRAREKRGEAMSPYALLLPKIAMYERGANPVIYGLDDRAAALPGHNDGGPRLIAKSLLPECEQYRYVTYSPAGRRPIDWSHEREWRWPYPDDISRYEQHLAEYGLVDTPADVPHMSLLGDDLIGMGVIVRNDEDARRVAYDLLVLVDRKRVRPDHYDFILRGDMIGNLKSIRDPDAMDQELQKATIDLASIIEGDKDARTKLSDEFAALVKQVESEGGVAENGELGGCWLWLLDNTHELTRALIQVGRVLVSSSGRYVASLPEFSDDRGLRQRERMTRKLAKLVQDKFGVEAGYFSVLGSDNINGVPFYCDDLDNNMYYNKNA